jgi:hypothetical protein
MTAILIEQGLRLPRSPWDVIAIVGLSAKGDGLPTLIGSLSEAIAKYGERLSLSTKAVKTIADYGLVDAIETIYTYCQIPIIAVSATPNPALIPVAEKTYKFTAAGTIQLENPNIGNPVVVKNSAGAVTHVENTDYTIDRLRGIITRVAAGTIPAEADVKVTYSVADFAAADWVGAINRIATVTARTPSLILTSGVDVTATIATTLEAKAVELGAFAVYTQPGASATAAVPLTNSRNAIAIYPQRTSSRGREEASTHIAGAIALNNYWESPEGDVLKGNTAALTVADAALLRAKGISWGSDRIMNAIATNGTPFNIARLQVKTQLLANKIAAAWRQLPFDLAHLEGIAQGIRDRLNREPEASLLPYATVNFNPERSSIPNKLLAYDVILQGGNAGDRIAEIIVYIR